LASNSEPQPRDAEATKERILAAAVKHFGIHGYGGASLRNIAADAGANVAAANYHFGSKAKLLVATVDHYITCTHERRFELLAAARQQPIVRPRLRALIAAYLRPHFEITVGQGNADYARLLMKVVSEDNPTLQTEIDRALLPVRQRFRTELRECCPDTDDVLLSRAISLIVSVLAMGPFMIDPDSLAIRRLRQGPMEEALEEATRFAYGGAVELLGLSKRVPHRRKGVRA
jgi:AcrR family transcriptional regulator